MNVSFRHLNPARGHESTLLRFSNEVEEGATNVLVDSGAGVDLDRAIPGGEHLTATLLTHAHLDHYLTLADSLRDGAPIYATPATATLLESVLTESTKHHDVGDVEAVLDRVEAIDGFTSLGRDVEVAPIPAGHVPGAASYVLRFTEDDRHRHVLVTGDFTRRRAAGYPGLSTDLPFDVDVLVVNVATREDYEPTLTEAVHEVLELAYAGKLVLVTAGALTGLQFAYVLGHAARRLDRPLPVCLVGQAAKLYESLGYDVPDVSPVATYDVPDGLLQPNGVTIAGPEVPIEGSARRLFDVVRDDPSAALVQLTTSGLNPVTSAGCTVSDYELVNHPPADRLDDLVSTLDPIHLVVKHTRDLEPFKERYGGSFVWANDDRLEQILYEGGEWVEPPWMSPEGVRAVRRQRDPLVDLIPLDLDESDWVPDLVRHEDVDLAAEGLDFETLERSLGSSPVWSGGEGSAGEEDTPGSDGSESISAELDVASTEFEQVVLDRLDAIEDAVGGRQVRARVVDAGDGVVLLRVLDNWNLEDAALADGDLVEVVVRDSE